MTDPKPGQPVHIYATGFYNQRGTILSVTDRGRVTVQLDRSDEIHTFHASDLEEVKA